ncbi:Protein kinase domain-containing protein [Aphelenchoides besseyi]|nr:Protein kinase domain-containing protein [Aphelenchoides besseyi]
MTEVPPNRTDVGAKMMTARPTPQNHAAPNGGWTSAAQNPSAAPPVPTTSTGIEIAGFQKGDTLGEWVVEKKLGEGGFGAVYQVVDAKGNVYALKVEKANEVVKVLKMEVFVLTELKQAGCRHFCDIIDRGRIANFNYVVMTLVGPSLQELRKQYGDLTRQKLSMGCALSIGIKCVEAIEELHGVGYLHRDIKPGNYAIGRREVRRIYLLDFGMARKYRESDGQIRRPRWAAGFRGTVRYAPISCHISREQARKDDLETWLYMQIELTRGALPWKHLEDKDEVGRYKERCRHEAWKELFGGCPKEYIEILEYLDNLGYYAAPDYNKVRQWLRTAMEVNHVNDAVYDWENALGPTPLGSAHVRQLPTQPQKK